MTAYLIADDTIADPEAFEAYKRAVLPLITKFGGRFISRGGQLQVLETGTNWSPRSMVIIEFPSMAAIRSWYESPEYATVKEIRLGAARSTLVALDAGTAASAS